MIKKGVRFGLLFFMVTMIMVGCTGNKEDSGEKPSVTGIASESDSIIHEEPTLSDDAKKLVQFKEPKKGDLLVEINVKNYGTMNIKLFSKYAPKTVNNFLTLVEEGYYDGVNIETIIKNYMMQSGSVSYDDTTQDGTQTAVVKTEVSKELLPYRGAVCMVNNKESISNQFFIIQTKTDHIKEMKYLMEERYKGKLNFLEYLKQGYHVDISTKQLNNFLQYGGAPWLAGQQTIFGQVIDGFSVLDEITNAEALSDTNTPKEQIVIESIKVSEFSK